jgi:hypothetical protein
MFHLSLCKLPVEDHVATDNFWGKFRRWRRHRPFWGGLFLILSAVELFFSANMSLGGIEVHIGPQGFLSYLLPVIIIICGLLSWFTPQQRLFYGIVALLSALYSFIGLNLGGFFVGMLLGILGGALVIAWGPPRNRPGQETEAPPTGEPTDRQEDEPVDVGDDIFNEEPSRDADETQQIPIAGHDDRPHEQQQVRSASFAGRPSRRAGLQGLGRNRKVITFALVPLAVTATIVAGANLQASAAECPEGLPSRSTATSSGAKASATTTKPAAGGDSAATTSPAPAKTTAAAEPTTAAATTPAATPTTDGGNAITDGIEGFVDGVSNLLGIGGDESSSPSVSPSPSETATSTATPTTEPTKTTAPDDSKAGQSSAAQSSAATTKATTTAAAEPSASDDEIPCLGARVYGKVASADDIPTVAKKPGLMEVDSLTMYKSTYDGVVDMPTAGGGSYKALKFSMDTAVNKPFKLTIDEIGGGRTVITSKELTTDGTVKFYTSRFEGNLFGVIPVVFTPDQPPPLTLDILWFTKAKIQLSYVRCDELKGEPLKVQS